MWALGPEPSGVSRLWGFETQLSHFQGRRFACLGLRPAPPGLGISGLPAHRTQVGLVRTQSGRREDKQDAYKVLAQASEVGAFLWSSFYRQLLFFLIS